MRGRKLDITGIRFGKLVAVRNIRTTSSQTKWLCVCDCGNFKEVGIEYLKTKRDSFSCGCYTRESQIKARTTHGQGKVGNLSPTYQSWKAMRSRCLYTKNKDYLYYGGRGISICPEWDSFAKFLSDMGERPAGTTLDRINSNDNYTPSNCRWADCIEQAQTRRKKGKKHEWIKQQTKR